LEISYLIPLIYLAIKDFYLGFTNIIFRMKHFFTTWFVSKRFPFALFVIGVASIAGIISGKEGEKLTLIQVKGILSVTKYINQFTIFSRI
jgi:hypothetical protein